MNAVYGGVGQSIGSLIGGGLSKKYGISKAFYIFAGVDAFMLFLFTLYRIIYRPKNNHIQ